MKNYNNVTDIGFEFFDGVENPSGLSEEGLLVLVSDILTESTPEDNSITSAGVITIAGDHVLKAGKYPIPVSILYGKSGSEFKSAGEELSKMYEVDTTLFIPIIHVLTLGGIAAIKNSRFLVFIRRPGQNIGYWQSGTKGMPAKPQDASGGFATGPAGEVGVKIILKAFNSVPLYDFKGNLRETIITESEEFDYEFDFYLK